MSRASQPRHSELRSPWMGCITSRITIPQVQCWIISSSLEGHLQRSKHQPNSASTLNSSFSHSLKVLAHLAFRGGAHRPRLCARAARGEQLSPKPTSKARDRWVTHTDVSAIAYQSSSSPPQRKTETRQCWNTGFSRPRRAKKTPGEPAFF